ncbi:hypothetical protein E3N88_08207 [Mikania micrantha]|uniref:Integrase catalytic domain-containing protein n=1 Tax=Mikania micrantha TaxID=192012 RepID=A0A5N6PG61_9ASTR|nr:hypothetical protein E3N88_08207 [Mikania micrantha]
MTGNQDLFAKLDKAPLGRLKKKMNPVHEGSKVCKSPLQDPAYSCELDVLTSKLCRPSLAMAYLIGAFAFRGNHRTNQQELSSMSATHHTSNTGLVCHEWCESLTHSPLLTTTKWSGGKRNRTILGMTRSILSTMQMPQDLWAEAIRLSVYILNQTPTNALQDSTPYQNQENTCPRDVRFDETKHWDWNKEGEEKTAQAGPEWTSFIVHSGPSDTRQNLNEPDSPGPTRTSPAQVPGSHTPPLKDLSGHPQSPL